jgi:formylmethanofuran dehydrogenase subunit E
MVSSTPPDCGAEEAPVIDPSLFLDTGVALHGHLCPGLALGLRLGAAAMNNLGVARDTDTELLAMLELGDDHCTHCLADGVQVITGCTLGKGNLLKLGHGKFGLTLVDRATKRAVRVSPRVEMQEAMRKSPFFTEYRLKNVPFSEVPAHVVEPLIRSVLQSPEEKLLQVGDEQRLEIPKRAPSLATFRCEACGEGVAERYGRLSGGRRVCIPCEASLADA